MVRQWQTTFYGKRYSHTDPHRNTDFVKLAEGFGLKGYRCTNLPSSRKRSPTPCSRKAPPGSSAASARTKRSCR